MGVTERHSELVTGLARAPALWAAVPFVVGILLADAEHAGPWLGGTLLLSGGLFQLFALYKAWPYDQRWLPTLPILLFFLGAGVLWQCLHDPVRRIDDVARKAASAEGWAVRVHELAADNGRVQRVWVRVEAAMVNGEAQRATGRLLVTLQRAGTRAPVVVGDRLLIAATARPADRIPAPGGFDQRAWAYSNGVTHSCFAADAHWSVWQPAQGPSRWFEGLRQRVDLYLARSGMDPVAQGLAKAVLLGLRDDLTAEHKDAFIRSGTMHVLAVSGGHVVFIHSALMLLLGAWGGGDRARWGRGALVIVGLLIYAGVTGAAPSVLRATATFILITIAEMVRGRSSPLNGLCMAAFLLLLWDPLAIRQLGFQLSFLAVLGIVLFQRSAVSIWTPPNKVSHYIWTMTCMSITAQIFTVPLTLFVFGAFPVWFLPANMVVVPMVGLAVYLGALVLALHAVPYLGPLLAWVAGQWLAFTATVARFFSELPMAYPAVRIDAWQSILAYGVLLLLAGGLVLRSRKALLGMVACGALLAIGWVLRGYHGTQASGLVVYDDRERMAIGLVQGRSLLVLTDTVDSYLARALDAHMRHAGLRMVEQRPLGPGSFRAGDLTVLVQPVPDPGPRSCLPIVHIYVSPTLGTNGPDAVWRCRDRLVISGLLPFKERQKLERIAEERGIVVHSMRTAGAFVVDAKSLR